MANRIFRKLHRQIAPILFLPLAISAITGIAFSIAVNWGKVEEEKVNFLINLHKGAYLGELKEIYLLLLALGVIGAIATGLTMMKWRNQRPPQPESRFQVRQVHQIVAPIILLPLAASAVTGVAYQLGFSWWEMPSEAGDILLKIHQGEYLGEFLSSLYVLLLGLSTLLMLITGINLTGIFRKRRQPKTENEGDP